MKQTTWILVADGGRARLLCNTGTGTGLVPANDRAYIGDTRRTGEIGTEPPSRETGHGTDGAMTARHGVAPRVDWHAFEKTLFAREMAGLLNRAADEGAFDRLVLIAPPKSLGDLRHALNKAASDKIVGEIVKDLTKEPVDEIGGRLEGLVRL